MPFQQNEWAHLEPLGEDRLRTITNYTPPDDHIRDEERLRAVRPSALRPQSLAGERITVRFKSP
jgi:hypothetical protein